MIEVVSAVIIRNGRILLTQRPETTDFPLCWECPGGKVEDKESHHDALRRECIEELGLNVMIDPGDSSMWNREIARPGREPVLLFMYRVVPYDNGVPKPLEGQGIGWFTAEEMRHLARTPGNVAATDTLYGELHRTRVLPKKEHCPQRLVGETVAPHAPCDTGDFSKDGGK